MRRSPLLLLVSFVAVTIIVCRRLTAASEADEEPRKKREYKEMEHKTEGDLHAKVDMNTVSEISIPAKPFPLLHNHTTPLHRFGSRR